MTRGVCIRCGEVRGSWRDICPSCGHRPEGEGLLVAWLLSEANLPAAELEAAGKRIAGGDPIRPSEKMLDKARRALGTHFSSDPGLTVQERIGLLLTSLFLTPLVGWAIWFWWRRERPRAAIQALGLSLPMTILFTVFVLWLSYQ